MIARSISAFAVLGLLGAAPASAQSAVTPSAVLAAKAPMKGAHGFADRTARITSIMGPELSANAPLNVPTRPLRGHPVRRDADATAGIR